jgi:lysophospholipase L1-like esterase
MAYTKHNFKSGDKLYASQLNEMDEQIYNSLLYTEQTLTEEQKAQARANIGATAGVDVEFADSVEWLNENGDTSKKYVLPDGYIYAWIYKSELIEHNANDSTGYLNQAPTGAWGNTIHPTARTGGWTSPLISIDPTKIAPVGNATQSSITISGIDKVVPFYNGYSVVVFYYKSDGSQMFMKTGSDLASINTKGEKACPFTFNLKDSNVFADSNWAAVYGVRIALGISTTSITADDVANLKVNMPALNYENSGYGWYSTGQQHSNDKATQQNSADIATLKEEVAELQEAVQKSPSASGAKWFAIGDSITYGLYSTSSTEYSQPVVGKRWVDYVAKYSGYELTNLGKSNAGFLTSPTFRSMVDGANFADADLVTIMLGINDWKYEEAVNKVGSFDDDIATGGTIVSELRYGLEKIISQNPYCKIILITPINAKIGSRGTEATNWAYGFSGTITPCGSLKAFGDKLKEVCEYYGIQVIDMTNSSVVNRKSITTVLPDGIHPNLDCYKALGLELARRITFA